METDKSEPKKRIGLFGGTLDPIHLGHLRVAEEVYEALELDTIWFVPAYLPPHKRGPISPFEHRLEMVKLATEGVDHFEAKALEAERQGISYSVDLLEQVRDLVGHSADIYFIIGTDAAIEIDSWKDWQRLPELATLVIVSRPTVPMDEVKEKFKKIFPALDFRGPTNLASGQNGAIITVDTTAIEISSTDIREKVKKNRSIRFLVPESVRNYIMRNNLYIPKKSAGESQEPKQVSNSLEAAGRIYDQIEDNKGEKITVLDMRGISPVADFFIIAQGRSTRHVQGMANKMKRELSRQRIKCRSIEGEEEGKWILLDFEDVVVHLFYEPVRAFYDLEGLWREAPRLIKTKEGLAREESDECQQ